MAVCFTSLPVTVRSGELTCFSPTGVLFPVASGEGAMRGVNADPNFMRCFINASFHKSAAL